MLEPETVVEQAAVGDTDPALAKLLGGGAFDYFSKQKVDIGLDIGFCTDTSPDRASLRTAGWLWDSFSVSRTATL